jgi:hypothetical protein
MDQVYPNLFIGDLMGAQNKYVLQKIGITHIINLAAAEGFPNYFPYHFRYMKVVVKDNETESIFSKFQKCNHFIS